jgi:RNA polymerase sigma-70 factor, ECF subfamily
MMDRPCPGGVQSTEAVERALLALVSTGDRRAMDQLYVRYFARLASFFRNMTVPADLVEELINDTMFEVWKAGESFGPNASVLLAIMRLAYSRVHQYFAEARAGEPHSQHDVQDREQSTSLGATANPSDLQVFLSKLPVEERALLHLVYASGCSRRETAEVMDVACDCVDVLLHDVRASAKLRLIVASVQAQEILRCQDSHRRGESMSLNRSLPPARYQSVPGPREPS